MRRYSLLLQVKNSAARSCKRESCTSLESIGWTACLALCLAQILHQLIGNVHIYSGPVDSGLGQVSHFFYASVVVVEMTEHLLIQLKGYTHSVSL